MSNSLSKHDSRIFAMEALRGVGALNTEGNINDFFSLLRGYLEETNKYVQNNLDTFGGYSISNYKATQSSPNLLDVAWTTSNKDDSKQPYDRLLSFELSGHMKITVYGGDNINSGVISSQERIYRTSNPEECAKNAIRGLMGVNEAFSVREEGIISKLAGLFTAVNNKEEVKPLILLGAVSDATGIKQLPDEERFVTLTS